jgi:hypothetical protein
MDHLLERFRDGRISVDDFTELKRWLESDPDVPPGLWYKRFAKFTLVGKGEYPKTFLSRGMLPKGEEAK